MSNQELFVEPVIECSVCWSDKDKTTGSFTIDESLICEACVIDTIRPMFEAALEQDEAYPVRWGSVILKPEDFPGVFPVALSLQYERRGFEIYSNARIFCKQPVVTVEDEFGAVVKLLAIPTHDGEASEECGCLLGVKVPNGEDLTSCPDCLGKTCCSCGEPVSAELKHICTSEPDPFAGGVKAHEDLDKAHWQAGSPCPKYNFLGDENAWQDDESDDGDEDEDEEDSEDEEDEESESDDDGGNDFAEFEEYAAEKAAGEASSDEYRDETDDGAVFDDVQDEVVDGHPVMSQRTPDIAIEAEWQAALVMRSDAFNTSQQHIMHRIEDLLHLPEGLAGEDLEHYHVKVKESTVLKVYVDAVESFHDVVATRPALSTANIRSLGSKIRTLNKLEPLVTGLSDCFESRFLIEVAQRDGNAITEAQIDEVFDRLLQVTRGQSAIWEEFSALLDVHRGHLNWLGEQWRKFRNWLD
ncbi:hypothetical protein LTR17_004916 [Elasticomyces elasticus]|nr:hypothetical protein LTR17_004916 [Elasticomyces elasticus]